MPSLLSFLQAGGREVTDGIFKVPRKWNKGSWQSAIRARLDEKFRDEQVKSCYITESLKCLVTLEKPTIIHQNPYNRIEFETEHHHLEYQVVPKNVFAVMEG
jgi:hypothetical protein